MERDELCRLCGSNKVKRLFLAYNSHGSQILDIKEKFRVFECDDCKAIFLGSVEEEVAYRRKYYGTGYYDSSIRPQAGKSESRFLKLLQALSYKKKQKYLLGLFSMTNRRLSLLDIGCGDGCFLDSLDKKRFSGCGIELNGNGFRTCREKGLDVIAGDITVSELINKSFDIITMWHVLEHIGQPIELFSKVGKMLTEKGFLVFQVPNSTSLGFRLGKKRWFHLDAPRHLIHYRKRTVALLCEYCEFEIFEIKNEWYDYPSDLFWSVRYSPMKFILYPFYPISKYMGKEHLTFICKKK